VGITTPEYNVTAVGLFIFESATNLYRDQWDIKNHRERFWEIHVLQRSKHIHCACTTV